MGILFAVAGLVMVFVILCERRQEDPGFLRDLLLYFAIAIGLYVMMWVGIFLIAVTPMVFRYVKQHDVLLFAGPLLFMNIRLLWTLLSSRKPGYALRKTAHWRKYRWTVAVVLLSTLLSAVGFVAIFFENSPCVGAVVPAFFIVLFRGPDILNEFPKRNTLRVQTQMPQSPAQ